MSCVMLAFGERKDVYTGTILAASTILRSTERASRQLNLFVGISTLADVVLPHRVIAED
jgi:hypothetical protein